MIIPCLPARIPIQRRTGAKPASWVPTASPPPCGLVYPDDPDPLLLPDPPLPPEPLPLDPPPPEDEEPADDELDDVEELDGLDDSIFISVCLTMSVSSVVMLGEVSVFFTAMATRVDPVGDANVKLTAFSRVCSPAGVMRAAFICPAPSDSAMNRCILGVSNSSFTAFCIARSGDDDPDPPDDPPDAPPLDPPPES